MRASLRSCTWPITKGRSRKSWKSWTGGCCPDWGILSVRPPNPSRSTSSRTQKQRPRIYSGTCSATITWRSARTGSTTRIITDEDAEAAGNLVVYAVEAARRAKSEKNVSLKTPLKSLSLRGKIPKEEFEAVKEDILAATQAEKISYKQLDGKSEADFEHDLEI